MKRGQPRKLRLNRETLRRLADNELKTALGGLTRHTAIVKTDCPCIEPLNAEDLPHNG